jgi:hypothetical protein
MPAPSFTEAKAARILERLSKGEPLTSICRDRGMPAVRTVSHWKDEHPEFAEAFAKAREDGFDALAAECLEIADDASRDTIHGKKGDFPDTEWIARSKLRVETRLKLLAKWDPKRYGERSEVKLSGEVAITPVLNVSIGPGPSSSS